MAITDVIFSTSTIIDLINSVLTAISGNAANKKVKQQQEALQQLRSDIDSNNITDNHAISQLNSVISALYNMRFQLDPRVIKKVDNAINVYSNKVGEAQERIAKREDEYNRSVQKANANAPTGTAFDMFKNPRTFKQDQADPERAIKTETSIKASKFENSIGGKENA